jgi:thioesterase domain-containing protein
VMDCDALISVLRARDIKFALVGDKIKFDAPVGALDDELRELIAARKEEIREVLKEAEALKSRTSSIILPIKADGSRAPLFVISGYHGNALSFVALARLLDHEQPLLTVLSPGLDGSDPFNTIEEIARHMVAQIQQCKPDGPYFIAGHCSGGTLAFEVAQQLVTAGETVSLLALIGSPFPSDFRRFTPTGRLVSHVKGLFTGSLQQRMLYFKTKLRGRLAAPSETTEETVHPHSLAAKKRVAKVTFNAIINYEPKQYSGAVDLFITEDNWHQSKKWGNYAAAVREHNFTKVQEEVMLLNPHVSKLALSLQEAINTSAIGNTQMVQNARFKGSLS